MRDDGITSNDVGKRVTVAYQSRFHPKASRSTKTGEIVAVQDEHVFIEHDDGRELRVANGKVTVRLDGDGKYSDRPLGDNPEVTFH